MEDALKNNPLVVIFAVLFVFVCFVAILGLMAAVELISAGFAMTVAGILFLVLVFVGYFSYKRQ